MEMRGERHLPAPPEIVWDALNDTGVLQASIPGCDKLDRTSENEMKATASVKLGPISARFNGTVRLTDIDPPHGYTITGEGQGGVAGFAKGGAKVALAPDQQGTLLTYDVNAQVGGKLAQLGARLIDATAKQMADAFFERFAVQVANRVVTMSAPPSSDSGPETAVRLDDEGPKQAEQVPMPQVSRRSWNVPIVATGFVILLGALLVLVLYGAR